MVRQGAPIDVVVMESSGHYWFNLASHLRRQGISGGGGEPVAGEVFCQEPAAAEQERPGGRAHTCGVGRPVSSNSWLGPRWPRRNSRSRWGSRWACWLHSTTCSTSRCDADARPGSRCLTARSRGGCSRFPGVGPSTAASRSWPGSVTSGASGNVDQLLAYAGVHPEEQSSGTRGANPETSWTMAKTGNAYLRAAGAYRMAVVGAVTTIRSSAFTTLETEPRASPSDEL